MLLLFWLQQTVLQENRRAVWSKAPIKFIRKCQYPFQVRDRKCLVFFATCTKAASQAVYRDPITNFWGNMAHFSYFWFLIVKKAQLNPTLYEHHKLFMNNWSLPSISKFFWFDISHALSNKGSAKRTQHFNAKSFNIVARKRVAHFWPRLAHVWPPYSNMLQHVGWFWIKFWIL